MSRIATRVSTPPVALVCLLISSFLLALLVSCAGTNTKSPAPSPPATSPAPPPPPPPPGSAATFLYITNAFDHNVTAYKIGANGMLTAVSGSPFSTAVVSADSAATDTQGHFLFSTGNSMLNCSNLCSGGIAAFTVDQSTGSLTAAPGSPFIAGTGFRGSEVHPGGKFLYTVDINVNQVFGLSIGSSGALTSVPGSPFAEGGVNPFGVSIHGSGHFLYAANSGSNDVSGFSIDANTGSLVPIHGSPFNVGAGQGCPPKSSNCAAAVAVAGNFLYYVNAAAGSNGMAEGSNIAAFTIDPVNGALTPIFGSPFSNPGSEAQQLVSTPNGRFLYVINSGSNNVTAYSIDPSSGVLTQLAGSPVATGSSPLGIVTDPQGSFLYVTNTGNNTVSAYAIASTGQLMPIGNSPTGNAPLGIAAAR